MRRDAEVNYAANPYGYPPESGRGGRRWTLWLAVVGVLGFGGGVLYMFGDIGGAVIGGPPPTIEADQTPTKHRPTEGGVDEEVRPDRLVYERLAGVTRPTVERLLPPPEMPIPRPIVVPEVPPEPEAPVRPVLLSPAPTTDVPPPGTGYSSEPPHDVAAPQGAMPGSAKPPAASASPPVVPAPSTTGAPPAAAAPMKETAAVSTPPKAVVAEGTGRWRIQLASVRTEAEAVSEWRRLSSRHSEVLGGVSMLVTKADLGDRGLYYRVQGAGVDEARARSICDHLKSQNVGCVVVRP